MSFAELSVGVGLHTQRSLCSTGCRADGDQFWPQAQDAQEFHAYPRTKVGKR